MLLNVTREYALQSDMLSRILWFLGIMTPLFQFLARVSFWQSSAVVARCHDFAVCSC